jgi:hypothetical protein
MTKRNPLPNFLDLPGEVWRAVPGFDGYEASNMGRARTWKSKPGFFRSMPVLLTGATKRKRQNRVLFLLRNEGRRYYVLRGVLVLMAFVGPRPKGLECCHWDGDATNDTLQNLRWDTKKANVADQYRHGTANHAKPGEAHHGAKLTEEAVRCIRAEPQFSGVNNMLARAFDVTAAHIYALRSGKTWKHVQQGV